MANTERRYHWTAEQKQEMARLYRDDWSIEEVAQRFGCTRETIRYHLRRADVTMRRVGMQTARARAKYSGEKHGNWKGGRRRDHGYVRLFLPDHPSALDDGSVPEHRLVMEEHLRLANPDHPALDEDGFLRREWIVHHRNGAKADNRIENLETMPRSQHHSWIHYQAETERLRSLLVAHGISPD